MKMQLIIRTLSTVILLTFLLSACGTTPEVVTGTEPETVTETVTETEPVPIPEIPEVPENPDIVKAHQILTTAKAIEAEWLVIDSNVSEFPVSLSEILAHAEKAEEDGDSRLASELALKVIRLARLGIEQAVEQWNATPYYPD